MTFQEAINSAAMRRAESNVWRYFRSVPGFYLTRDDIGQIGMISMWKLGNKLETMNQALLYTIAWRKMFDECRQRIDFTRGQLLARNFPELISIGTGLNQAYEPTCQRQSPFAVALRQEICGLLDDPACKLTRRERAAAKLYYIGDLDQVEVAKALRVSPTVISMRLRCAGAKLRNRVLKERRRQRSRLGFIQTA